MSTLYLKNRQEVEDFVRGCTFYGTGGGGLPANGIRSLMSEIEAGHQVGFVDVNEIPDDAVCVCPFLMGSIAPHDEKTIKEMESYGLKTSVNSEKERLGKAIQELEDYTGKKATVIVPIELGGANTPAAVAAASYLGIIAVDGDYTSRAIPEIIQITFNYHGKEILPVASVDEFDNRCIIKKSVNPRNTEKLGKLISQAGYGLAGQAGMLLSGKELKEIVIAGTLTGCYEVGKIMRESREAGEDYVAKVAEHTKGKVICRGKLTAKEDYDEGGYYWGTNTILDGKDEYKYWYKNEIHVLWKNNEPLVTSPDTITVIDLATGEPLPNPLSKVGMEVAVVAIECRDELKSKKCIDQLGPRYFGFDFDYVTIGH